MPPQAVLFEAALGKLAAIGVAALVIDHAAPARVFPGGRADEDPLLRKGFYGAGEAVAVECHRQVMNETGVIC